MAAKKRTKETSDRVSRHASRLMALVRKDPRGRFEFFFTGPDGWHDMRDVTAAVKACVASALSQDETPGKRKAKRLPVEQGPECPLSEKECCQSEPCKFPGKVRRALKAKSAKKARRK